MGKGAPLKAPWIFAVLPIILAILGCAPIGGIGGGIAGTPDTLWIVPKCMEYETLSWLSRDNDLAVFGSYNGAVVEIPVRAVDIGVIEDEAFPDSITWTDKGGDYYFTSTGRKTVVVNYETMTDRYTVRVKNPGETVGNPGGNDGGSGIIIEWG